MMPFRWPSIIQDISLATEVAARKPNKPNDWDEIANVLIPEFSTQGKPIKVTGRACRERFEILIQKYKDDDKKSLKRSCTEEEYTQLHQLLEDIYTYRQDMEEQRSKDQEAKKKKEKEEKKKGEERRAAALVGMGKRKNIANESGEEPGDDDDDDDGTSASLNNKELKDAKPKTPHKKRATRLTALELLQKKSEMKADLKEKELEKRNCELDFQKEKYREEAEERKERLRRKKNVFISIERQALTYTYD